MSGKQINSLLLLILYLEKKVEEGWKQNTVGTFRLCLVPGQYWRKKKVLVEMFFLCLAVLWKILKNIEFNNFFRKLYILKLFYLYSDKLK